MAHNTRRGLRAHRDGARLLAGTAPVGPRRLRHIEATLRVLRSAGLSGKDAVRAAYHLNNCITEFAADEARFAATDRKMLAQMRRRLRALSAAEYPVVVELADELADDDQDGLFRFGLEIWLRGIEQVARETRRTPRAAKQRVRGVATLGRGRAG
jgi:TetR/AcrR family tetracycline transcriptional repressor